MESIRNIFLDKKAERRRRRFEARKAANAKNENDYDVDIEWYSRWISPFWQYYFWHGTSYEYRLLRFVLCLPIGCGIGILLFFISLDKLNIVNATDTIGILFYMVIVGSIAVCFAWSPVSKRLIYLVDIL